MVASQMIALALKLLTSRIAGPIGAGVSIVLLLALLSSCALGKAKNREIEKLTVHVAKLSADLGTCRTNKVTLQNAIDRQNAAVAALAAEGQRRAAEARKALDAAQAGVAAANKRAGQLLAIKPGADRCASAEAIIIGGLE
jgi:hypothetical protein